LEGSRLYVTENRRSELVEVVRPAVRGREIRDAEDAAQPVAHLVPRRVFPELELDASHDRTHGRHVQPCEHHFQIAHEQLNEPGTVLPLQRELFVMNDNRPHELGNRVIGYRVLNYTITRLSNHPTQRSPARCRDRTALSIVAGSPVSVQSPASSNPRTPVSAGGRAGWPGASENVAFGSRTTVARIRFAVRAAGSASRSSSFAMRTRSSFV